VPAELSFVARGSPDCSGKDATVPSKITIAASNCPFRMAAVFSKTSAGKLLYVKKGSMEDQLAAFFNDPNSHYPEDSFLILIR
jgi:hypothetical protein